MSVYIKDMEMPTNCGDCPLLDESGDYPMCRITREVRGYTFPVDEKRMDRCPLVWVPKHGRLIDADELQDVWADWDGEDISGFHVQVGIVRRVIDDMDTVVPADD